MNQAHLLVVVRRGHAPSAPSRPHRDASTRRPSTFLYGAHCSPERGLLAYLQEPLGVQQAIELDDFGHDAGPAGLVAGAEPGAVVAVEILIEQNVIAPVRVGLELLRAAVHRPPPVLVAQEHPAEPLADLFGDLVEIHHVPGAGGTLDLEVVAVV